MTDRVYVKTSYPTRHRYHDSPDCVALGPVDPDVIDDVDPDDLDDRWKPCMRIDCWGDPARNHGGGAGKQYARKLADPDVDIEDVPAIVQGVRDD